MFPADYARLPIRQGLIAPVLLISALAASGPALAEPGEWAAITTPAAKTETWAGGDAFRDVWSLYSGTDIALGGPIVEDGLRLRIVGGYGEYRHACKKLDPNGLKPFVRRCSTPSSFTDALVGYRWQHDAWTFKALAGVATGATARVEGGFEVGERWQYGGKLSFEVWYHANERLWAALDASYTTLKTSPSAHGRIGYRLTQSLSFGLEGRGIGWIEDLGGLLGDTRFFAARIGPLVRYEWESGEISLTGGMGVIAEYPSNVQAGRETSAFPYATANVLFRY